MSVICKVIKTEESDGHQIVTSYEIYTDDAAKSEAWTISNFESRPLKDEKTLVLDMEGGVKAAVAVPLKTQIKPGEVRIYCTDDKGNAKSEVKMLNSGNVEVTIANGAKLKVNGQQGDVYAAICDAVSTLKDSVEKLISATVSTSLGPQTMDPGTITQLTTTKEQLKTLLTKLNNIKG